MGGGLWPPPQWTGLTLSIEVHLPSIKIQNKNLGTWTKRMKMIVWEDLQEDKFLIFEKQQIFIFFKSKYQIWGLNVWLSKKHFCWNVTKIHEILPKSLPIFTNKERYISFGSQCNLWVVPVSILWFWLFSFAAYISFILYAYLGLWFLVD